MGRRLSDGCDAFVNEPGGRSPAAGSADTLVVSEVFGPTLQGEGPTAGRRAAFVRLGRCNLDCSWCDTPFTWNWARYDPAVELSEGTIDDIVDQVSAMGVDRVVVTGGEPLLQQRRLLPLLREAETRGWDVEVETNGTLAPSADTARLVSAFNVSPKLAHSGVAHERAVVPDALVALMATGKGVFKFVVTGPGDLDEVAEIVDAHELGPVWIMPEGTTADAVVGGAGAVADAVVERGWNLSSRLHVLLWGDERGR